MEYFRYLQYGTFFTQRPVDASDFPEILSFAHQHISDTLDHFLQEHLLFDDGRPLFSTFPESLCASFWQISMWVMVSGRLAKGPFKFLPRFSSFPYPPPGFCSVPMKARFWNALSIPVRSLDRRVPVVQRSPRRIIPSLPFALAFLAAYSTFASLFLGGRMRTPSIDPESRLDHQRINLLKFSIA